MECEVGEQGKEELERDALVKSAETWCVSRVSWVGKMYSKTALWVLAACIGSLRPCLGQVTDTTPTAPQHLIVHASSIKDGEERVDTLAPGRYRITAVDLLPAAAYELTWFTLPEIRDVVPNLGLKGLAVADTTKKSSCDELEKKRAALFQAKSESEIPVRKTDVEKQLEVTKDDGSPECAQILAATRATLQRTYLTHDRVAVVRTGEYIRIRLIRQSDAGPVKRTWRYVATRGSAWVVSYGLNATFLPDAADNRPHFVEQAGSTFTLKPRDRRSNLDPSVAVSYTWLPSPRGLQWTPLASGIGLDFSGNPAVYLGTGVAFQGNLFLSSGAVVKQISALNDRYRSGQEVPSLLSDDQVNSKVWKLRPYLALSWRFASNPFGGSSSEAKPQQAATGGKTTETKTDSTKTGGSKTDKPPQPK